MARPPKNLEELRQEYVNIRRGVSARRFGSRSINVLKWMLDEPGEVAVKSISEIAREQGINTSSVTRLAQRLDFDGFPALQNIFRKELKHRRNFYSEQVTKFLEESHCRDRSQDSLLHRMIQDEWSNVMLMLESFDKEKFAAVVDLLVKTPRIRILGLRSSFPLAYYLGFYLQLIRGNVAILGQPGHTLAEDMVGIDAGDLLLAISVNPYTRDTVQACRIARMHQVQVAAITDSRSSPLAIEADHALIVSIKGDYFFSPMAAAVIIIETLLSEVVKRLGKKALQRLNQTEHLIDAFKIEVK